MKIFMKLCLIFIFTVALVCLPGYGQSKENGAVEGKVFSEEQALPGVEVTLTSPNLMGGKRVTVTNTDGKYRFVALPYGEYAVVASLEGFSTVKKTGIKVTVGKTVTIDFSMTLGKITEQIEVTGSALIDVKDSQTAVATISRELIEHMPNSQTVANIVNLAPGVTQDSAFGAHDYGVQYQIDGVDVSDPGLGSSYVFIDYGVVEEAQVMGIGAPAEYGGFTGIVFNTVTKTGSNTLQGMFDSYVQLNDWNASNTDSEDLTPPADGYYNAHLSLGGPFVKDKLWFFAAAQYLQRKRDITGYPEASVYDQPRLFFKLTYQPNEDNRFSLFLHIDRYDGNNRAASVYTTTDAVRDQKSPEMAFNGSYLHVFNDTTFFEAKFAGFLSYYKLLPHSGYDTPGHKDIVSQMRTENWSTYYHSYRTHIQVNTALSHHADDFIAGSHDFKFGLEGDYNPNKDEWGYPGGRYYYDNNYDYYPGANYYRYDYEGYSTPSKGLRVSAFVQDSWEVSDRLKINAGVRINYNRGTLEDPVGTIFKPEIAIAPRIGFTFDLFGDHTTAIKAHYGRYYENLVTGKFSNMAILPDFIGYLWGPVYNEWYGGSYGDEWVHVWTENSGATTTSVDENLGMPYMDQFTVGIERELFRDLSVGVTLIHRVNKNFIDRVLTNGQFEQVPFFDDETGNTYMVYSQVNDPSDNQYIITNPHEGDYGIVMFEPIRKYTGIELLLNKKFSNNWTLLASYVYSKTTGNVDNYWLGRGANASGNSTMFRDPNPQINADGRLSIDPTHMVKIQGSIVLPWKINVGFNFSYMTGNTYNRILYVSSEINQRAQDLLADEAGSKYRYPAQTNLDLRVQKDFTFGKIRVGVLADVFNLFNDGTVEEVVTEAGPEFGEIVGIVYPRRFRIGLRVYF
ncbi:MAG: TonB-dependent receptor [bacterium]|nr:TonB-dependent receptor [bacterium]